MNRVDVDRDMSTEKLHRSTIESAPLGIESITKIIIRRPSIRISFYPLLRILVDRCAQALQGISHRVA